MSVAEREAFLADVHVAARYVGDEGAEGFLEARPDVDVLVQLTPERWHTSDLGKA